MLTEGQMLIVEKLEERADISMTSSHIHDYYEIYYLSGGKRRYFINHTLYDIDCGDVILVDKGDIHRTQISESGEKYERYLIHFSQELVNKIDPLIPENELLKCFETKKLHVSAPSMHNFNSLLRKLENECKYDDAFNRQLCTVHFIELMINLNKFSSQKNLRLTDDLTEYEDRIQSVCKYICNYYNRPINLEEIAKIAYMSPTYFSKKFKKVTGFGFNEYLNSVRVKMAINMLLETRYSITEIAMYCGYQDSNYFGDVFRKMTGMSPSAYRKQHITVT
jgi:YesN/AraC family two-component response regulator